MSDPMRDQRWVVLADKMDLAWSPEREWAVRAAVTRRTRRRRTIVRTAVVASVGIIAAGGLALTRWPLGPSAPPFVAQVSTKPSPPVSEPALAALTVTQLSADTVLAPLPEHGGRGFALQAGGARFSVPHDPYRPFVVAAGDVTIQDLGTTFTVRYLAADRLTVAVEEGRVRVHANGTDTEVAGGATLEIPVSTTAEALARRTQRPSVTGMSAWRPLAQRGRYEEARRALKKAGPAAVRDDTEDLLLAADAARLSGHPGEAVSYLERVLHGHARDPRAGLAAFTLGRVLLDELGRPREAVDAFAFARSAGGPLAEDALAREVEAASRAGDEGRGRELARTYRQLYPDGRRANSVARFGGLD